MEKAMQIKYQKKFCCNCGKWFNAKADRFLVCSCGNTDPMELNEKYGVINWGNNELMLAVLKAKLAVFSINDYTEIIPILCNLPIISGIEVKNKVKKLLPIEAINESAFANWRTWMIVSHFLHYNHSVLYKNLWESGNISVCEALIMECVPHTESISDDICNKINSLPTDIPQKVLSLAISNIIEGMDAEVALFLAKNNIEVYQFEEMLKKTGITPEQGIKDIKEYSVLSYEGQTILKQIGEYYSIINWFMLGIKNIIDRCNVEMPKETHYPKYPLPEGTTAGEYLRKLAEDGIPQRYSNSEWTKAHRERLEYELKIIHEMGFDDYHLIVQDFLNYAREKAKDPKTGIGVGVGPGRGSAVGSLVCYLIGITDVDPIKHDLLFERYLNPERVTMPDIDSDFAKFVRPSAFEYVKNLFGERNVCIIETDARQPPKAAIKAVGRVYGDKDYNEAAEKMASFITMKDNKSFSTVDNGKTLKERLLEKFTDAVSVDIINMAELIEGSLINYGTHAAGVVIADNGDISEYVPLKRNKDGDKWACQCSKEEVEGNAGLLKFDFLGLINLDIENNCLREIYKNHGRKINLSKIPFEKEVFRSIFATGRTNAVFQFESAGMKQMLKEFKPDCIEDIILLVAAYRPGPMQYLPEIKAVKSGEKKAEYIFPKLSEVLSSTYGKPVYQEQIQAIFHRFAGCSLGEADIVRRAMSKKKIDILTDPKTNYKGRFIDGMIANGSTAENAEKFWIELLEFANYAFNKSHAAAYAYLAYQTAWLKYHYPAEYLASVLKYAKIERYPMLINEAHNFNIAVLPPSIRYSEEEFTAVKGMINFGIGNIKGIGNSGGIIIEERNKYPFSSFKDFLKRVPFKQNQLEALIDAGVFDEFNKNRLALNSGSETVCDIIKHINQKKTQLTSHLKAKEKEEITPKELKTLENKILNVETASLYYLMSTNLSYVLIILCAAAYAFLYLKDEITMSVREEQNIL